MSPILEKTLPIVWATKRKMTRPIAVVQSIGVIFYIMWACVTVSGGHTFSDAQNGTLGNTLRRCPYELITRQTFLCKDNLTLDHCCRLCFIIAEVCLLAGSARNAYHTKYKVIIGNNKLSCDTLRKGVFATGAAFTFFTTIFSELYYVSYSKARQ